MGLREGDIWSEAIEFAKTPKIEMGLNYLWKRRKWRV